MMLIKRTLTGERLAVELPLDVVEATLRVAALDEVSAISL